MGRLLRNRALVLQTLGLATLSAGVFGFVHYDRDYVQVALNLDTIIKNTFIQKVFSYQSAKTL